MNVEQLHAVKQQALALLHANRPAEARALLSQICEQDSEDVDAWHLLSTIYGMQGNMDEAGRCCRRVIALHPDHSEAHVNLGNVLLCQGKLDEAILHYQTAIGINPSNAGALCSLGNALSSLGKHDEATINYQAALRLNPNLVEAYYNLGNSQMAQKRYVEAMDSFRHAIRLNPNYAAAYNNLGNAHKECGDIASAIENYRIAARLQPNFAMAYNNLSILLKERGQLQEAYDAAHHALRIQPDFTDALFNLGNIHMDMGEVEKGISCFQALLKNAPNHPDAHSCLFMMMHYRPEYSPQSLFTVARDWGVRHSPPTLVATAPANTADPQRRLRLGYVSGDFYNHPAGYFIESVLAHHDSSQYETYCYYNHNKHDELTTRLQHSANHWRNIAGQSDDAVISQIREDHIDILIDLSGHTDRNRLLVFAHKPAPVQVTWLGYFDTTGLSSIDYIFGDRFLIPADEERYYVERVLRLPKAYLCYSPPNEQIEPGRLPALASGKITFGCFNNPAKLTDAVIACWSKILLALPQAQLYLKYKGFADNGVRQRYQDKFAQHGIDSARIRLAGASPRRDYLATYQDVDIGLDTFPFNGCTTTMESLWMGVPVVTLRGNRYVGHMGESIMMNLGMEECVTDNEEAYITKAIALASDLPPLAALRSELRNQLLNSSLCDGPGFTRSLERMYREIWLKWCQKQTYSSDT